MPPPHVPMSKRGPFSARGVDGSQSRQHRGVHSRGRNTADALSRPRCNTIHHRGEILGATVHSEGRSTVGVWGISALHCGLPPRHETPSPVWFNPSGRIPSPLFRGASATEKGLASLSAKPFMLLVEPTGIEPVTSKIFGDLSNRRRYAQTTQNWLPTGSHIVARKTCSG